MNAKNISNDLIQNFNDFKIKIKEISQDILSLNNIEYDNEIKDCIKSENEINLFYEFLFFTNYSRYTPLDLESNFDDDAENKISSTNFNNIKAFINSFKNNNDIYRNINHMHVYFLNKIENFIISTNNDSIIKLKMKDINQYYSILVHILSILCKLYQQDIYNLKMVLLFFDTIIIFIKKRNKIDEKYIKLKKIIFFDLLFEKYFGYFTPLVLKMKENNNKDIILFLNYIIKVMNSKELNSYYNYEILSNNEIISKFIFILLNNINYQKNIDIYNEYKQKLLDSFANVYKNNTSHSNFFEELISHNKNSFINLMNYKTKKEQIITDIYMESFYIELLNKLFSDENSKESMKIKHEKNFFRFNGFNSKMTFQLYKFNFSEKSVLFFSFQLNEAYIDKIQNNSNISPLLYFNSNSGKDVLLFKLYIQKENSLNKLYIYQEKGGKKNKIIGLDKLGNIKINIQYILSIKFNGKKIAVFMKQVDKKGELFSEEIDSLDCEYSSPVLKIGHDDEKNEYFNGYIGPIIIIKNTVLNKNSKIENIINNILNLNNLYHFFPMLLSNTSFYHLEEKIIFSSIKEEDEFNNIKLFLQDNLLNFLCEIYLTPEILGIYYSLFMKNQIKEKFIILEIPNICDLKTYIINDINISLMIHSSTYNNFIKNNGFDYFILIYEYIYQFLHLMNSSKNELDFYHNNNLENIFIDIINSTIIILHENYLYYKHYIYNTKKLKNLFMNLYEILKLKNHKILDGISQELYYFSFDFILEFKKLKNKINDEPNNKILIGEEKMISSFAYGLMKMIFDFELYQKDIQNNSMALLFLISGKTLMEYKTNKNPNKIFPFEEGFFFWILNFINVFAKEFNSEYDNKNIIIKNFFELIEKYIEAVDKLIIKKSYFRHLFIIIKNNQNNLIIIKYILNVVYNIIREKFLLDKEEIGFLSNLFKEQNYEEEENNINNNKLIDSINISICKIFINQSFLDNSKEILIRINNKLANLKNLDNVIPALISELSKYFDFFLIVKNQKDVEEMMYLIKYMDIYENIFNFILDLLKLIIKQNEKTSSIINLSNSSDTKENNNFLKIIDLLNHLNYILKRNVYKNINGHRIFCLINLIKFYYRMIFFEKKIFLYSNVKLVENFLQIIELCYKYCLINSYTIYKFIISNNEFNKTLIEMIFEIFLELCFADESSIQCYNLLLDKYACPFFDRQFIDNHKYSIFYVIDNLNYFVSKKKTKDLDGDLKKKCQIISLYDQLFNKQEIFNGNFSTYFLLVIIDSQKKINDKGEFNNMPKYKLEELLNDLYSLILEEHILLYKTDKKYFFKTNPSNYYNEALIYIKDKHVKKKSKVENFNKFLETIFEKMDKEKNKALIINKNITEEIKENPEDINEISDTYEIEQIKINYNKTIFFYELDKYYVTNIKKEIMNNIFSVYYLDEFFYSKDFCVVKKYYMNNYINDLEYLYSKKLNFPSIVKNYSNDLGPPLFIKKFNNYIIDPYFSITHSYINDEILKKNLSMSRNIKLNKKNIKPFENDASIECEILKNEQPFFGKLYYNNFKGYLLFKEERNNFGEHSGYKYIFLMSKYSENNKNIVQNNYDKSVLILLDEVEEIIEMRILLLWKGFEIFLKNGKSYIFNFLTTDDYDNFMKNFVFKSRIKNLVRKRNFLSDKTITKAWVKGLLSNFDYILILNRYSSRSFNDPTQYPVFPWLLNNYRNFQTFLEKEKYILKIKNEYIKQKKNQKKANTLTSKIRSTMTINTRTSKSLNEIRTNYINFNDLEKNMKLLSEKKIDNKTFNEFIANEEHKFRSIIRDFRYLMSFQTEEKRKKGQRNYEEDIERKNFPSHTGCHYSNSGFVYYYLMRQQPYGNLLVKLQEFKTENPNRCFMNIADLGDFMISCNDNRELIPELFSKIECFLNLNCDYYGELVHIKTGNDLLDDCIMTEIIDSKDKSYLSSFVSFILQHKKIMNSQLIGVHLNKWIDIIFGFYQFPPENLRKESYNITSKYSYEQSTNLEKKLEKKKKKEGLTESDIILKINFIITYIISFGVTPSFIFNDIHPKIKFKFKENNKDKKNKRKSDEKSENNELNELVNIEDTINESLTPDNLRFQIKGSPIYFEINPTINKLFIYIKDQGSLLILENELYNEISYKYFSFLKYNKIEKSNILCENINSVYQIKYGFSSFYKEFTTYNGTGNYHTYYYYRINDLLSNEKILDDYKNFKFNEIMVITCRHIDFSFKIYYLDKDANEKNHRKKNIITKIYSYICEDFVTCCCCVSSNAFLIGLNNGKLIYYIIKENPDLFNEKNKLEQKDNIIIEKDKYIQAHKGKINSIDIDKRLGIVITSGDDNYIFIRKLYDFELLLPIKIKNKFTILMTKVSSYNFLYVLCFNKSNFKNIIFGYTLSGIKFAKSEYGRYDNISINEDGNILTMNYKEELLILSGSDLKKLNNFDDKEMIDEIKNLKHISWLQFDYFERNKDAEHNEIITCLKNKMGGNFIKTININSKLINDV